MISYFVKVMRYNFTTATYVIHYLYLGFYKGRLRAKEIIFTYLIIHTYE